MNIHIGKEIKKRAGELRIGSTELARRINTSKQNIAGIYKRASLDSLLLYEISKALSFNFFSLYDFSAIEGMKENPCKQELETLKKEHAGLLRETELLRENNALLKAVVNTGKKREKS